MRLLLIIIVLTTLGLLAAGAVVYRNLPQLVSQHAAQLFAENGVTDVSLASFTVNRRDATISALVLTGQQDGLHFDIQLDSLTLRYAFWDLLRGRAQALDIASAVVSIDVPVEAAAASAAPPAVRELLPYRLASSLPLDRITIEQLQVSYRPATKAPIDLAGRVVVANSLQTQLVITQGALSAALALTSSPAEPLKGQLTVSSSGVDLGEVQFALEPLPALRWRWQLNADLQLAPLLNWLPVGPLAQEYAAYHEQLAPLSLSGSTGIEATIEHTDDVLDALAGGVPITKVLTVQARGAHALDALAYGGLLLSGEGSVTSNITVENGGVLLGLTALSFRGAATAAELGMDKATTDWLGWPALAPFEIAAASVGVNVSPDDRTGLTATDLSLSVGDARSRLRIDAPLLALAALPAGIPDLQQPFTTNLGGATIDARVRNAQVPLLTATLQQAGALHASNVKLRLRDSAGSLEALLQGEGDLLSGDGSVEFRLGSDDLAAASVNWLPLVQSLELMKQNITVTEGHLALQVKARSKGYAPQDDSVESTASIGSLSGTFADYSFDTLNVDAHWRGLTQVQTIAPVTAALRSLDVGIPVTDIRVEMTLPRRAPLPSAQFVISEAQASLLGGRAFVPAGATWQFGAAANDVLLKVENWQIDKLVALQRSQDIQAVGQLSGDLPRRCRRGALFATARRARQVPWWPAIRSSRWQ